ncbi:MAG: hypothetical protein EOP87_17315 [Verrucomicrobiaceae bacterium]|nr:MAG: hypothetical protein EOP87_17315 [Verrucomicrobiaceae bacterium]
MKISLSNLQSCSRKWETLLCSIALSLPASVAHGAVLIDDNFTNSSGASVNMGNTQAVGVGTYENIQGNNDNLTITTVSGFGSGNVLQIGNNANTYFRAFNGGSSVKLSALTTGQTLTMSFDFRTTGDTNAQNFGFGFLNSDSAIAFVNLDARSTTPISEFKYRPSPGGFNMSTGGTSISTWTDVITPSANNNIEFSITRTEVGYLLRYLLDGTEISSTTNG